MDASFYELVISSDPNFISGLRVIKLNKADTIVGGFDTTMNYFWRVRAFAQNDFTNEPTDENKDNLKETIINKDLRAELSFLFCLTCSVKYSIFFVNSAI